MLGHLVAAAAGFIAGVISGFGVGGGTILMLWLTAAAGLDQRTAQGINLLYFLPTALAAVLVHSKNRYVLWRAVLPAALAGCITAAGFSFLAMRMNLDLLRRLFGGFLILTGISELFKKVS